MHLSKLWKTDWESKGMLGKRIREIMRKLTVCVIMATLSASTVYAAEVGGVETTAVTDGSPVGPNEVSGWPQGPEISSRTACVIDAETGVVLYDKGMTEKMFPASTTKVMTALIAIENSSLDEVVVFTETGVAEAYSGSSNLYTQVGEEFTMEECLYALMLKSANDFASQIAEHVAGSTEAFAQMMNDRAKQLGCVNTNFVNAHGLEHPEHYTCAYDLTLIMREAAKNETFCKIAGTLDYTISATHLTAERHVRSHNELLRPGDYYYEYCIAGKTGYTDEAMNTFVSIAEKDGRKLVESTMYSPSSIDSFLNAKILYEYGFSNFQNLVIEEGLELYSGGMITIPNTAMETDVVMEIGDIFETDFGTMITEHYSYNGYPVGTAAIKKEVYDERTVVTPTPTPTPEEETAPEDEEIDLKNIENLEIDLKPIKEEGFTTAHIIIGVFGALVIIGILLIMITIIYKSRKKSKKKRRKR